MAEQIYTREYLCALPVQTRKSLLKRTIIPFVGQILAAATAGKRSIDLSIFRDSPKRLHRDTEEDIKIVNTQEYINIGQSLPTVYEICEALGEKFPDCDISYEEKWEEISPEMKQLRKAIVVDWSKHDENRD